jgi:hypothetical protein
MARRTKIEVCCAATRVVAFLLSRARRRLTRISNNERLLERVNYAKLFPWVTKEREILPGFVRPGLLATVSAVRATGAFSIVHGGR